MSDDHYVTRHEAMSIAQEAGRNAAIETLKLLGFEVSDPIEVQKDIAYLRKIREADNEASEADRMWVRQAREGEQATKLMVKRTFIGTLITGMCLALWQGFKHLTQGN